MSDFDQPHPYAPPHPNAQIAEGAELHRELKNSGIGIASFTLAILGGTLMLVLFVVAGVMEATTPGGMDEDSLGTLMIGLGILGTGGMHLVGLLLGLVAVFQQNRKKTFGILGLFLNSLVILGTVAMMVLGLTTS